MGRGHPSRRLTRSLEAQPNTLTRVIDVLGAWRISAAGRRFSVSKSGCPTDPKAHLIAMGWTPPPSTASKCQSGAGGDHLTRMGASAMNITTVGIDLAKNVFQVHGVDARGKVVVRKQLRREQMAPFFVNLPPCLIGMEACGGAHHWGRKLQRFGHTVRLMPSQYVKPYVTTNKNDAADAEAICEAVALANKNARTVWALLAHDRAFQPDYVPLVAAA
jgi:hypothetical protein